MLLGAAIERRLRREREAAIAIREAERAEEPAPVAEVPLPRRRRAEAIDVGGPPETLAQRILRKGQDRAAVLVATGETLRPDRDPSLRHARAAGITE